MLKPHAQQFRVQQGVVALIMSVRLMAWTFHTSLRVIGCVASATPKHGRAWRTIPCASAVIDGLATTAAALVIQTLQFRPRVLWRCHESRWSDHGIPSTM